MFNTYVHNLLRVVMVVLLLAVPCYGAQTIIAQKVDHPPVIDGAADDNAWKIAKPIVTREKVADIDVLMQAVYTDNKIYFKVQFQDPDESRVHKPLIWNPKNRMYDIGPEREDTFIFKWAMDKSISDLRVCASTPYLADVWFWKANRTDPAGYADDKYQVLSSKKKKKSKEVLSLDGQRMYLRRLGDDGASAYTTSIPYDYDGDHREQFVSRQPTHSRADIMAKGLWRNNGWCIEFSRNLNTQHPDDVKLDPSKRYLFGVSRYEIAGRKENPNQSQPLYGAGDVSEALILEFGP